MTTDPVTALPDPVAVDRLAEGDPRRAGSADGLLGHFNRAGVLHSADVHVATTLGRIGAEPDDRVLLAVALAVRAVRLGSVCVDLRTVAETAVADPEEATEPGWLPWPAYDDWRAACAASPLVAVGPTGEPDRPVRLVGDLLYLDRYWRQEELVRGAVDDRASRPAPAVNPERLRRALRSVFPGSAPDRQRLAVAASVTGWLTVIAGGPGTGKTTTVARLLAVLAEVSDPPPRVALAAPTGKAAARLQEAVAEEAERLRGLGGPAPATLPASTLHRLLGRRPGSSSRFRHDRSNRLPYDVVVIDETSMVSLTLMARLLEALRPDARLVLVGDPDQLASVEAGAVLGDLVGREPPPGRQDRAAVLTEVVTADLHPAPAVQPELRNDVVRLQHVYRFGQRIRQLADAIRTGDADAVATVLRSGSADVEFVQTARVDRVVPTGLDGLQHDVLSAGRALVEAARAGRVAEALTQLDAHRLLCAHRRGPYGVARWNMVVAGWLAAAIDGYADEGDWHAGRPLLVTANDYGLRLWNGDTGVVVRRGDRVVAAFARGRQPLELAPSRLSAVQTMHALTVHRGQGSQFDRVTVLLPPADSPLLTRELLYTAVTRARQFVRVVGTEEAVRAAVGRPIVRASGLRRPR